MRKRVSYITLNVVAFAVLNSILGNSGWTLVWCALFWCAGAFAVLRSSS